MEKDINAQLISFRKILKKNADPERAINEKKYLKSPYSFFGVSLPFTERMAKEFRKANEDTAHGYVIDLVWTLWTSENHDEKRLGLRILKCYPEYLDFSIMPMLEEMLMHSTGWDLVDDISIHLVGSVLGKDERAFEYLRKWSESDNFWMRRASLISQILLFRKDKGDKRLFLVLAEKMIEEKEFFIKKAIGWALRELAKADSGSVFEFLMNMKGRASGLTLREASKRLSEKQRILILTR